MTANNQKSIKSHFSVAQSEEQQSSNNINSAGGGWVSKKRQYSEISSSQTEQYQDEIPQ